MPKKKEPTIKWEDGYSQSYHRKGDTRQRIDNVTRPVVSDSPHAKSHVKKDQSRLDMGKTKSKQKKDF